MLIFCLLDLSGLFGQRHISTGVDLFDLFVFFDLFSQPAIGVGCPHFSLSELPGACVVF